MPEGPVTIKPAIYGCKNAYTTVSASAMEVPCSPVADPGFLIATLRNKQLLNEDGTILTK
jgi:hypothetical protein